MSALFFGGAGDRGSDVQARTDSLQRLVEWVSVVRGVITVMPFSLLQVMDGAILPLPGRPPCSGPMAPLARAPGAKAPGLPRRVVRSADQWNCSSSVEPVSAVTLDLPPWITVVTSSK